MGGVQAGSKGRGGEAGATEEAAAEAGGYKGAGEDRCEGSGQTGGEGRSEEAARGHGEGSGSRCSSCGVKHDSAVHSVLRMVGRVR